MAAESKIIKTQQRRLENRVKFPAPWISEGNFAIFPGKDVSEDLKTKFRTIRLEKRLAKAKLAKIKTRDPWVSLQSHRKLGIRKSARAAHIAYAFLKNKQYFQIEAKYHEAPDWKEVEKNIKRFTREQDPRILAQQFEEWRQRGQQDQDNHKGGQKADKGGDEQARISA